MNKLIESKKFAALVKRNTKYYFKDKFMFLMSLLTPLILLVLFVTFLKNIYIDSFNKFFPEGFTVDKRLINGVAGAWLLSSLLGVSSVTVAFCSNIVMINDKIEGNLNDFQVSPIKGTTISISYFLSNFIVTFIVLTVIMLIGHIYLAAVGWYITAADALMIIVDIFCCTLFGTLLAGVVESFISTQGALSAVSTLVSSMYGFISGAYMPLWQFSVGLRNTLCLLPGTYGVGIMRNHYMNGYMQAFADAGLPEEAIISMRNNFDANLYLFGKQIPLVGMYCILLGACLILFAAYVTIVIIKNKKK